MKCTYTINDRSGMILRLCDVYHRERFYFNTKTATNIYIRSGLDILRGNDIYSNYVKYNTEQLVIIL